MKTILSSSVSKWASPMWSERSLQNLTKINVSFPDQFEMHLMNFEVETHDKWIAIQLWNVCFVEKLFIEFLFGFIAIYCRGCIQISFNFEQTTLLWSWRNWIWHQQNTNFMAFIPFHTFLDRINWAMLFLSIANFNLEIKLVSASICEIGDMNTFDES